MLIEWIVRDPLRLRKTRMTLAEVFTTRVKLPTVSYKICHRMTLVTKNISFILLIYEAFETIKYN